MPQTKRTAQRKRRSKVVLALGAAAGLSLSLPSSASAAIGGMNGASSAPVNLSRILHASCRRCTLDERDAVIDALRPLVEQGWQIDLTYSCVHEPKLRHVTLGARVDVFD
jgi:hypothetical protein